MSSAAAAAAGFQAGRKLFQKGTQIGQEEEEKVGKCFILCQLAIKPNYQVPGWLAVWLAGSLVSA